eukprot:6973453-Karenia_brevis.AAC.1
MASGRASRVNSRRSRDARSMAPRLLGLALVMFTAACARRRRRASGRAPKDREVLKTTRDRPTARVGTDSGFARNKYNAKPPPASVHTRPAVVAAFSASPVCCSPPICASTVLVQNLVHERAAAFNRQKVSAAAPPALSPLQ